MSCLFVAVNTADVRQTKAAVKKSKRIVSRFDMCFLDMTMPPAKKWAMSIARANSSAIGLANIIVRTRFGRVG
jgi:hypothetical protein